MKPSALSVVEDFCLWVVGKIIVVVGIGGMVLTIFYEQIARGMPFTFWSYQWLSVLGIVVFTGTIAFGIWTDSFLNGVVRGIIDDWAAK